MRKWGLFLTVIFSIALYLFGCSSGGGGGSESTTSSTDTTTTGEVYGTATAQLGNLANATVEIYEIANDGSLILRWTETTSSGSNLDQIGRFNSHYEELDDNSFYLYKVIGGEDWDADDNGIKDETPTINRGVIRAVAKGADIKAVGTDFRVTVVSEVVYEKVAKYLKDNYDGVTFEAKLLESVQSVIGDINNDGQVDVKDMLLFNPVLDRNALKGAYRYGMERMVKAVHDGKYVFFGFYPVMKTGFYDTTGYARGIDVSPDGKYVYIADGIGGLQIIDVSDPERPKFVGQYVSGDGEETYDVILSADGNYAYVAYGGSGLHIVDVSDPENPQQIGVVLSDLGNVMSMDLNGNNLYVGVSNKLYRVDVSDINNIQTEQLCAGQLIYPNILNITVSDVHGYQIRSTGDVYYMDLENDTCNEVSVLSGASAVLLRDNTLYLINLYDLKIYDVTTPTSPALKSSLYVGGGGNLYLSGDGKKLYIAAYTKGLVVVDVSDIENPFVVKTVDTYSFAMDVVPSGDETRFYIANSSAGLEIIDITDIVDTYILSSVPVSGSTSSVAVAPDGTKAYIVGDSEFKEVDITGGFSVLNTVSQSGVDITVSSDESFLILGSGTSVYVYDVGDFNTSTSWDTGNLVYSVKNYDTENTLVANGDRGIVLFNHLIYFNNNTVVTKEYDTDGICKDAAASPDLSYVYVADYDKGLKILGVSISSLDLIASVSTGGFAEGVAVSPDGNYVYIADGNEGLKVFDVSFPNSPQLVGFVDTPGYASRVSVSYDGTKVYIADDEEGIQVVDISNPYNPEIIATIKTPGKVKKVEASIDGKTLYVADDMAGLLVIDTGIFK